MNSKVFYLHTDAECKSDNGVCTGHRATIACRKNDNGTVSYGYSVCIPGDNFSRTLGIEKATAVLENTPFQTTAFNHFPTEMDALSHFAKGLSDKIYRNFSKYKQKLAIHRKTYAATRTN